MNKTWSSSRDLDATLGGMAGRALVGVGATAAILENNVKFFLFAFELAQTEKKKRSKPKKKKKE